MSLVLTALLTVLPPNRKHTPSGWDSFDAPCCHHRGESRDDRKRGGIMLNGDAFSYHCFNCGFKAGWSPGKTLSQNTRSLFSWLGLPESEVSRLAMEALREHDSIPKQKKQYSFELKEIELPENCLPILDPLLIARADEDWINAVAYLTDRKIDLDWYPFMWADADGYRNRVIIPFYQDNKIVGFTARKIGEGKPKYLAHSQPGYVFNLTRQPRERQFVILVEGQFDAIAIDGVCIGHNEPNEAQISRINTLGREVVVVPDRDKAGAKMLDAALENKWSASLPPWGDDIKDVADAVKQYGRLYTLAAILHYRTSNQLKIQVMQKKLQGLASD